MEDIEYNQDFDEDTLPDAYPLDVGEIPSNNEVN